MWNMHILNIFQFVKNWNINTMKKYVHDLFVDRIESDLTCVVTISQWEISVILNQIDRMKSFQYQWNRSDQSILIRIEWNEINLWTVITCKETTIIQIMKWKHYSQFHYSIHYTIIHISNPLITIMWIVNKWYNDNW